MKRHKTRHARKGISKTQLNAILSSASKGMKAAIKKAIARHK